MLLFNVSEWDAELHFLYMHIPERHAYSFNSHCLSFRKLVSNHTKDNNEELANSALWKIHSNLPKVALCHQLWQAHHQGNSWIHCGVTVYLSHSKQLALPGYYWYQTFLLVSMSYRKEVSVCNCGHRLSSPLMPMKSRNLFQGKTWSYFVSIAG